MGRVKRGWVRGGGVRKVKRLVFSLFFSLSGNGWDVGCKEAVTRGQIIGRIIKKYGGSICCDYYTSTSA